MGNFPYRSFTAAASRDRRFRARLVQDPRGAAAELGVEVPESVDLRVVVDTAEQVHAVVPLVPEWRGPESGPMQTFVQRYRDDPQFRVAAREQFRSAYRGVGGTELPEEPEIVLVEELRSERVIQLPPLVDQDIETFADVQSLLGPQAWSPPAPKGTYETGSKCPCFTDQLASAVTACCPADPEDPGGPTGPTDPGPHGRR